MTANLNDRDFIAHARSGDAVLLTQVEYARLLTLAGKQLTCCYPLVAICDLADLNLTVAEKQREIEGLRAHLKREFKAQSEAAETECRHVSEPEESAESYEASAAVLAMRRHQ